MPFITLDDDQVRVLCESDESVELRDRAGHCLGVVSHGFSREEIEEAKRRANSEGPWITTTELLQRITARSGS